MKTLTLWWFWLMVLPMAVFGGDLSPQEFSVVVRPAARLQLPGVAHGTPDPNADGDVDCSSPAHWDAGTMYMFYSTGHPFRSSGRDLASLGRPSTRVVFDN